MKGNTMCNTITANRSFTEPTYVGLQASYQYAAEHPDFDYDDEWSWVPDVIAITFDADNITLTTCRTVKRPDRFEVSVPRKYVATVKAGHRSA